MANNSEIYLILGCFGRTDDNFISCNGIENIILKIDQTSFNFSELMDYFDQYQLFDKTLFNYNAIRQFIFNLRDKFDHITRPLWTEKQFNLYQKFTLEHKNCGLLLRLTLDGKNNIIKEKEEKIIIKGTG